jgi:2-dehydro-3-deoxyglucarate aldolase/4-hydroxy-2-oxoheptanedioate aldolase
VVQVESAAAVEQVDQIAAIDGVDVLFVGPQDLSHNLGVPFQLKSPTYLAALERVRGAAERHGKACGLLVGDGAAAAARHAEGWNFVGIGSDTSLLAAAVAAELARARRPVPSTPGGSP